MSSIKPRLYYDELDNHHEIRKFLKTDKSRQVFLFLHDYLITRTNKYATTLELQQFCLVHPTSRAYQMLKTLSILNLLKKERLHGKRETVFYLMNRDWWEQFKLFCEKTYGGEKDANN